MVDVEIGRRSGQAARIRDGLDQPEVIPGQWGHVYPCIYAKSKMQQKIFSCNREKVKSLHRNQTGAPTMIDRRTAVYGLALLRITLGVMFVAHAGLKYVVFTMPGFAGFLGSIGLPSLLAWPIVLAELVGGVLLIVGFQARLVSVALLPILLGALVIHWPNGWIFTAKNGGWEYPAFLIAAQITHILAGDGALALKPSSLSLPGGNRDLQPAE
jgi:putative oxidoreductase